MNEKRYQVFVSSTYTDLAEERAAVIRTLMELDCIPAGMEAFPAADEEQLEFIKRIIDDCDYYVLIIAGRYGSIDASGKSYTQREFEYAKEKGIPILAFVKSDIDSLPVHKSDAKDPEKTAALSRFREEVMSGRMVKLWTEEKELPGQVALSVGRAIKMNPGIGWVRGDKQASSDILSEINSLRKENQLLKEKVAANEPKVENAAGLDTTWQLRGRLKASVRSEIVGRTTAYRNWSADMKLGEIFDAIAPNIRGNCIHTTVNNRIGVAAMKRPESELEFPSQITVDTEDFNKVCLQMEALGLIIRERLKTKQGNNADFFRLTRAGEQALFRRNTVIES